MIQKLWSLKRSKPTAKSQDGRKVSQILRVDSIWHLSDLHLTRGYSVQCIRSFELKKIDVFSTNFSFNSATSEFQAFNKVPSPFIQEWKSSWVTGLLTGKKV